MSVPLRNDASQPRLRPAPPQRNRLFGKRAGGGWGCIHFGLCFIHFHQVPLFVHFIRFNFQSLWWKVVSLCAESQTAACCRKAQRGLGFAPFCSLLTNLCAVFCFVFHLYTKASDFGSGLMKTRSSQRTGDARFTRRAIYARLLEGHAPFSFLFRFIVLDSPHFLHSNV